MHIKKHYLVSLFLLIGCFGYSQENQGVDKPLLELGPAPLLESNPTPNPSINELRFGLGYKAFEADKLHLFGVMYNGYKQISPLHIDFSNSYYQGPRYTTGAFFCEFSHILSSKFSIGATVTYFSYYSNYLSNSSNQTIGTNTISHFSIYPTIRMNYINKEYFKLYSSISFGPRFVYSVDKINNTNSSSTRSDIAGQVTLLGVSVGKTRYWFADICTLGTQGIFTTGIGIRMK